MSASPTYEKFVRTSATNLPTRRDDTSIITGSDRRATAEEIFDLIARHEAALAAERTVKP